MIYIINHHLCYLTITICNNYKYLINPGRCWRHRVDGTDGGAGEDAAAHNDATRTQGEATMG